MPALRAAIAKHKIGLSFDLILKYSRMGVSHGLPNSLSAQLPIATQYGDLRCRFYVAHGVNKRGHVVLVRSGVAFRQLLQGGTVTGKKFAIGM